MKQRCLSLLLLAGTVLAAGACGGDGETEDPALPQQGCLSFSSAVAPSSGTVTTSQATAAVCNPIPLRVEITDVYDIGEIEFTVNYNASLVNYSSYSDDNSILAAEGTDLDVVATSGNGRVTFVMTRSGAATGVDAQGTCLLITLYFERTASSGFSALSYSSQLIRNGQTPSGLITGVEWYGGTIRIG